ncbi:hypothetical protein [Shimia sp. MMG029]|uniref:hypothetical protein n=1 Tax=Shimia sp. MMG029 TaxID=3021978 RepID=UPI0022FE426A|nr:hypothetical protein [Shimia sp. MMG029]MDA5558502.1 hypothetical protein [Shimia sp. MMG029]
MSQNNIHLRRLTVTLPASMKGTAAHEARRIAEAMAQKLYENGGAERNLKIESGGHSGAQLAERVAAALPKGGRNGG